MAAITFDDLPDVKPAADTGGIRFDDLPDAKPVAAPESDSTQPPMESLDDWMRGQKTKPQSGFELPLTEHGNTFVSTPDFVKMTSQGVTPRLLDYGQAIAMQSDEPLVNLPTLTDKEWQAIDQHGSPSDILNLLASIHESGPKGKLASEAALGGINRGISGLTTPKNIAIAAGAALAPEEVGGALALGFGAQATKGSFDAAKVALDARQTPQTRADSAADAVVDALFGITAGVAGVKAVREAGLPETARALGEKPPVIPEAPRTPVESPEGKSPATPSPGQEETQPQPATAPAPVPEIHRAEADFLNPPAENNPGINSSGNATGMFDDIPVTQEPVSESEIGFKIAGDEMGEGLEIPQLRKNAAEAMKALKDQSFVNAETGHEISIDRTGIRKAVSGPRQPEEFHLAGHVPELIEKSHYVGDAPDAEGRSDIKAFHYYQLPVEANGKPATARMVVREMANGKRYYDHSIVKGDEPAPQAGAASPDGEVGQSATGAGSGEKSTPQALQVNPDVTRGDEATVRLQNRPDADFRPDPTQTNKPFGRGGIDGPKEGGFINPDVLNDVMDMGRAVWRKGMEFGQWAVEMVRRAGERIRPYLQRAWNVINTGGIDYRAGGEQTGAFSLQPVKDWVDRLKSDTADIPKFNDFKRAINGLSGTMQRTYLETRDLVAKSKELMPDPVKRAAVRTWIEAGAEADRRSQAAGSTVSRDDVLRDWQANAAKKYQAKYDAAVNFKPEDEAFARRVQGFYDSKLKLAQKWGVLEDGLEGYANRIWKSKLLGDKTPVPGSGGRLKTTPSFALKRSFQTAFDGEQAGYEHLTDDVGELMGVYAMELNKAIATRQLIKGLSEGAAADGRPLVAPKGYMQSVPGDNPEVHLVYPDRKTGVANEITGEKEPAFDYRDSVHSALKQWKWIGQDADGNPVMMQSDLAIHPDVAGHLNNILGDSWLRRKLNEPAKTAIGELGKAAAKGVGYAQGLAKEALFSFSGFHYVTIGEHVLEHRVNPFPEIGKSLANVASAPIPALNEMVKRSLNLSAPDYHDAWVRDWMAHGLMVAPDHVSAHSFMEGVGGQSKLARLTANVPVLSKLGLARVGQAAAFISNDLFNRYIPALKLQMAEKIYARNMETYRDSIGRNELTPHDVKYLTAKQVNAATSHLNMIDLGRNPTLQHIASLTLLAPDFSESRARFVGQAAKGLVGMKVGREQAMALAVGAGTLYATTRVLNQILDGDPHFEMKNAFAVISGNRRYEIRSVAGDVINLLTNTRGWIQGRLSPLARGLVEGVSGVNYRGEKVSTSNALGEMLTTAIPITMKQVPGLRSLTKTTRDNPVSPWEQFLGAMGVHTARYSPITETYSNAHDWKVAHGDESAISGATYPTSKYQQLRYALEDNDKQRARAEVAKLKASGMTDDKIAAGFRSSVLHPFSGRQDTEEDFRASLDARGKAMYDEAVKRREAIMDRFEAVR